MRVIIAGSRTIKDYGAVERAIIASGFVITQVVSGKAGGPDTFGEEWAQEHNVPVAEYPANWRRYERKAGYLRNKAMALNADALIAVWDGKSHGTENMIRTATDLGLQVYVSVVG